MYDALLTTEPILMHEGEPTKAKVIGRKRNQDGKPVEKFDINPLLNTRIYLTEFPDGRVAELSANVISEALYKQVDDDGYDT
jgi:hypothetical protein